MKKENINKILLYFSFLPISIFAICCIIAYSNGMEYEFSNVKGYDALLLFLTISAKYIVVLIACIVYQVYYFTLSKEKKYKNLFITAMILIVLISTSALFAVDKIEDYCDAELYQEKPYSDVLVLKIPYDEEKHKDNLNTTIRIRYEELFAYIYTHYGDEALYPTLEKYEGNFTPYMVAVSNVVKGNPIVDESNVRIEINENKKDIKMIVDYEWEKAVGDYIIISISDAALTNEYTLQTVWK